MTESKISTSSLVFVRNKGSCVEKIPKSSINYDLKICDKYHGHIRMLFGYKYVMLLVIIVIFIAAILIFRSVRIQRAKKIQKCQKEASKIMETSISSPSGY